MFAILVKISSFTVNPTKPLLDAFCFVMKFPAVPEARAAKLTPASIFINDSCSALDFWSNPLAASAKLKSLVTDGDGFGSPTDVTFVATDSNVGVLFALTKPPKMFELPPNKGVEVVLFTGVTEGSDLATTAELGVPPKILVVF